MSFKTIITAVFLASAGMAAVPAAAGTIDFSNPVAIGPTAAPGVWYTDRYAPAGFATSGGKLNEKIVGDDFQTTPFNNTQGRALDLDAGTTSLSIDLFVNARYANEEKRWAGLWGVGVDSDNAIASYPILEFTTDGTDRFRGYDVNLGTWFDLIPTGGIVYNSTYTLNITLSGGNVNYAVGGATASVASPETTSLKSVILQGYNTGSDYVIQWDNLVTAGAVPEPATWLTMIGGFGLVGGAMRRQRRAPAAAC